MNQTQNCKKCNSTHTIKSGKQYNRYTNTYRQNYECKNCGFKFRAEKQPLLIPEFKYQNQPIPKQNWKAYNNAQTQEKIKILEKLEYLLNQIIPEQTPKIGRPTIKQKNIYLSLCLKTYTRLSSRRLTAELQQTKQLDHLTQVPHFTVLMQHLKKAQTTKHLKELLHQTTLQLPESENKSFSIDSTGFSTSIFGRWYDHKYGKETTKREWLKCHAIIDNKTNMVLNANITEGTSGDSPQFEKLVNQTSQDFQIGDICADKAYLSRHNLQLVTDLGGTPFIPFKSNTSFEKKGFSKTWHTHYEAFHNEPQKWGERYHKRSNIESTFSMIKRKFGTNLVTKTFNGQQNEILLKIIIHNLCCLIQEEQNLQFNPQIIKRNQKAIISIKHT